MNGRVYDPLLGRFLSPDPVVSGPGGSQGWNLYAYVGNNPLSRTDPTGLRFAPCMGPSLGCPDFAGSGSWGGGGRRRGGGGGRTVTVTSAVDVFGVRVHHSRVWQSDWELRWDPRRERWVREDHGDWDWQTHVVPYSATLTYAQHARVVEEAGEPASEPIRPVAYVGGAWDHRKGYGVVRGIFERHGLPGDAYFRHSQGTELAEWIERQAVEPHRHRS